MAIISVSEEWVPFVTDTAGPSSTPVLTAKGYARYLPTTAKTLSTAPSAGVAITSALNARHALISVEAYPIRIRTDATAATATEGLLIPVGTVLKFSNQPASLYNLSFIDTAAGASQVTVMYFK